MTLYLVMDAAETPTLGLQDLAQGLERSMARRLRGHPGLRSSVNLTWDTTVSHPILTSLVEDRAREASPAITLTPEPARVTRDSPALATRAPMVSAATMAEDRAPAVHTTTPARPGQDTQALILVSTQLSRSLSLPILSRLLSLLLSLLLSRLLLL